MVYRVSQGNFASRLRSQSCKSERRGEDRRVNAGAVIETIAGQGKIVAETLKSLRALLTAQYGNTPLPPTPSFGGKGGHHHLRQKGIAAYKLTAGRPVAAYSCLHCPIEIVDQKRTLIQDLVAVGISKATIFPDLEDLWWDGNH